MIATINTIDWVDRPDKMPYGIIKATAVQGDVNADLLDEDGFINPMACMTRTFNLTKSIFPATEEQVVGMQESYVPGRKLRLGLFEVPMGKSFYIVNKNDGAVISEKKRITKTADKAMVVDGKALKIGDTYEVIEDVDKVFTSVSLVLFTDKDGKSVENDGEEVELIANRSFLQGIKDERYILIEQYWV